MKENKELWLAIIIASILHGILFIYFYCLQRFWEAQPRETPIRVSLINIPSRSLLRSPKTLVSRKKPQLPQPNLPLKGHQKRYPSQQKAVSHPIRPKKPMLNPGPLPKPLPPPPKAEKATEGKMANNSTIRNFSQTGSLNNPGKLKPIAVPEVIEAVREAKPKYADNPKPTYPRMARRKGYQGTVWLRVLVLANGQVSKVEIAKSSGYPILDHTALKTVKEWRFYPAMKGDMPVTSWVKIPIIFRLLSY